MAVAVRSAVFLMRDVNNGEDDSQNGREINTNEYIMEDHGSRSP
jgi:hypothetical protein